MVDIVKIYNFNVFKNYIFFRNMWFIFYVGSIMGKVLLICDDIIFKYGKCLKNEWIIVLYFFLLISL